MEIYYRKAFWVSPIFAIPAISVLLIQLDIIEYGNKVSDVVGYSIVGVCSFFTILTLFGSTRLYFDNVEQACIQIRKQFYGQKKLIHPYSDILNIIVRYRRDNDQASAAYKVGFTKERVLFGQTATEFHELRYVGIENKHYLESIKYAKEICKYSGLSYLDETKTDNLFNAKSQSNK